SSSKITNLFPQISPSFQASSSSSFIGLNSADFFLHYPQNLVSGHHFVANAPMVPATIDFPVSNKTKLTTYQEFDRLNGYTRKQIVKKDRHSKIITAQGPRDRRMRLSIGTARKFFDLQEMLGFDKPSKTLDWLLTNSKIWWGGRILWSNNSSSTSSLVTPDPDVPTGRVSIVGPRTGEDTWVAGGVEDAPACPLQVSAPTLDRSLAPSPLSSASAPSSPDVSSSPPPQLETPSSDSCLTNWLPLPLPPCDALNCGPTTFLAISSSTGTGGSSYGTRVEKYCCSASAS
ncbi:Hypothetical predicted protein, partial [Olea europaea subsp. europaea]